MNYEKEYKKALERAMFVKENTDSISAKDVSDVIEYIFSELKESEDERIRKWLIAQLELKSDINNPRDLELMILKTIAWLEKKGQKLTWSKEDEENLTVCLSYINDEYLRRWLKDAIFSKYEQKSAWSKNDEEMWIDAIKYLELFDAQGIHGDVAVSCIEWLKSLKDRVQPKQKWSEDDCKMCYR